MKRQLVLPVLLVLLLSACSGLKVTTDYDQNFNFTTLKTWSWKLATQPETGNKMIDNPLRDRRVRSSIDTVLKEKGMSSAESSADFLVSYEIRIDTKQKTSSMRVGVGVGSWGYGSGRSGGVSIGGSAPVASTSTPYQVGTLYIDVLNPANDELLWRGTGQATMDDSATPEEQNANMLEAVRKIMETFPPGVAKKAGS
jgi:hypothetical protein